MQLVEKEIENTVHFSHGNDPGYDKCKVRFQPANIEYEFMLYDGVIQ